MHFFYRMCDILTQIIYKKKFDPENLSVSGVACIELDYHRLAQLRTKEDLLQVARNVTVR